MKKSLIAFALLFSATVVSAAELVEGIVVRVGDRIVTRTQYERRLRDTLSEIERSGAPNVAELKEETRKNLVNEMISELLIKDRADRIGIRVTDAEVQEAVGRLKQQYNITTDEQFNESLRQSGMTRADMEARLRDTLVTNKLFGRELRNRQDLTDAELRERYNREKESYRLPERAVLREIVVLKPEGANANVAEAQQRANDLAAAARKPGTEFAKLASTMSEAGSREKGGELGEVARGDLVPELDNAVFNATAGAVVGPLETKSAWHIIKVEQRLPSEVPGFETVKDRLRRDAGEETFQRDYKAYIETLRKDAFIQIHEEMIPKS